MLELLKYTSLTSTELGVTGEIKGRYPKLGKLLIGQLYHPLTYEVLWLFLQLVYKANEDETTGSTAQPE